MENRILSVGSKFPEFKKTAVVSLQFGKEFDTITSECHKKDGQWMVFFWWPKDFTFVCPTEIEEFNKNYEEFKSRNTMLLGGSTDSEFVHLAWRKNHPGLKNLKFPMVADTSKSLCEELGILEAEEKIAYRATYIVDPEGTIRWVSLNDLSIGRNIHEVIRVLDALQTGELTPCNWEKGEDVIKIVE
ncbi:MAG: peroxiredoxin [Bacteroidota bacterium]|nr:peroxiredoxin [Bacteroidota bacterium]MDP4205869.1 peroxiredoxin [Bacteroidota bacterium]